MKFLIQKKQLLTIINESDEKNDNIFVNFDITPLKKQKYPDNSSNKVMDELKFLKNLPKSKDFVLKNDDILKVFVNFCEKNDLKCPKSLIKRLIKDSSDIIMDLKTFYNRPRPQKLAKKKNIVINSVDLASATSPSYPSGHSTQGILIANVLKDIFPEHSDDFLSLGKKISLSRNIGRVHYPSDSKFGEFLGKKMYEYLKSNFDIKELSTY